MYAYIFTSIMICIIICIVNISGKAYACVRFIDYPYVLKSIVSEIHAK